LAKIPNLRAKITTFEKKKKKNQTTRCHPKVVNPTSLFSTILTIHDVKFESIVGILPGQIKGKDLALIKIKYLYSTPYK
jgi:hypothetical protein